MIAAAGDIVPRHVAIIMDGNRRWARANGLPALEGHRRGIVALRNVTRVASDLGVQIVTVYGFSTENWCVYFARTELGELQRNNVRVRVIGDWQALPDRSRRALRHLQAATAANTGLALNLAVNYSSRSELERAVRAIANDVASGALAPDRIDDELISSYLYTAGVPDPDLLIRPGGEQRLSNFLLYQAAYTELVMSDVFWPDFSGDHFAQAVREFSRRQRRFGE
jgi:undecaprenyl diphosphate synthase